MTIDHSRPRAKRESGDDPPLRVRVERGSHSLWATAVRAGRDLVVVVGGGERPHVGCVALAQARPSTSDPSRTSATTSLLAIPPHKEGEIASRLAASLARTTGAVAVVSVGIHDDDLSPEGVAAYLGLAAELETSLLELLSR